jgi:hypothetical protein
MFVAASEAQLRNTSFAWGVKTLIALRACCYGTKGSTKHESTMTHGCCFSEGDACGGGQRRGDNWPAGDDVHASFGDTWSTC